MGESEPVPGSAPNASTNAALDAGVDSPGLADPRVSCALKQQGNMQSPAHSMNRNKSWMSGMKQSLRRTLGASSRAGDVDEIPSQVEEEEEKKGSPGLDAPPVKFWELLSTADNLDKLLIVIGVVGALGQGVLFPLFAILFGDFTDAFGDPDEFDFMGAIISISLKFVWIAIAALVSGFMMTWALMWAGSRQAIRLRTMYLAAAIRQDIAFFDTHVTTGDLVTGLNSDSVSVQAAISEKFGSLIHHSTTFLTGYAIAFSIGWDMTLVMLGCLPLLAFIGFLLAKLTTWSSTAAAKAYSEASGIAQQSITQIRTVAAYNQENAVAEKYDSALMHPLKVGIRQSMLAGISLGAVQLVMLVSYSISLYYGAVRVEDGAYTGGQVMSVQIATLIGGFALGQAAPLLAVFSAGCVSGGRMFFVIRREPEIGGKGDEGRQGLPSSGADRDVKVDANAGDGGSHRSSSEDEGITLKGDKGSKLVTKAGKVEAGQLANVVGKVELVNVKFTYPSRLDVPIFNNFNLHVPAGHTVALVGSSGSGKSTVVQLMERFYDPEEGAVLLDGVDIRNLSITWLRDQIGLVSQEPTLFATTIFENIAIGKQGASEEEVVAAASAANAHKFVSALPDGYHTHVGERGTQLSGGQKQRIAIARAILKNPKILLLDEATSALDNTSEKIVQQALDKMIVGRTTVVVAHRLSTIRNADTIAVVKNGEVVERGTHEDLVKDPNGAYHMLVQFQLQGQTHEEEAEEEEVDAEETHLLEMQQKKSDHARISISSPTAAEPVERKPVSNLLMKHAMKGRASSDKPSSFEIAPASGQTKSMDLAMESHPDSGQWITAAGDGAEKEEVVEAEKEAEVEVSMKRLIFMNRPEWHWLGIGSVASFIAGCQQPAFAFVLTSMITLFYTDDMDYLKRRASFYSWMFFLIGAGAFLALWMQQLAFGIVGQNLSKRVRGELFSSILKQEISWFDREENSSGRLASDLTTEATHIRGAVADVIGLILQNMATMVLGYVIAFVYDWRMALLITGILPLMIMSSVLHMQYVVGASGESDKAFSKANQTVTEAFSSIRVIQAYNLQGFVSRLYGEMLVDANKSVKKASIIGGLGMGLSMFIMFGMYSLIIWFGGWEVNEGLVDFDGFLKAFIAILLGAMGLAQAGLGFPAVGKAKGAIQRVFPIIDRQPLIDSSSPEGLSPDPAEVKGAIVFEHVRFVYPNRPKVIIFKDLCLEIPAGKMCALVGESGSGKSTVVGLLERFYDPLSGRVLLDGVDIREYNLKALRSLIGLVSQEPLLFSGTIADNIRVGNPSASIEEVEAAALAANAKEFITKLPEGLHTKVGEGGIQLSGGQKQRVAIARAYIKGPKILLLDEATSALDTHSEKVVQEALDALMVGRTSIVIAHRLSTIRHANSICVVYRGVIMEKGTHEELMGLENGFYARMVPSKDKQ